MNIRTLGPGALGPGRVALYASNLFRGTVAVVEVYRPVMVGESWEERRDGRYVWAPVYTTGVGPTEAVLVEATAWWKERC